MKQRKDNIDRLLDTETVVSMKKRPLLYLGGKPHEGLQTLFANIFKVVLPNSSEPLKIEWIIENDENCCLIMKGGNLSGLKQGLEKFIKLAWTNIDNLYSSYYYYIFFLFFSQLEASLVCNCEQIYFLKRQNTFTYDYQSSNQEDNCILKFTLDKGLFIKPAFLYDSLREYVKNYAYQYPVLTIAFKDERTLKQLNTYHFPNGLQDKLDDCNYLKSGGGPRLWDVQYDCIVDGCHIKIFLCIENHIYLHPPCEVIYAEDYLVLHHDQTIKRAVIKAMKQSMEDFSEKNSLALAFKEEQLYYLTDFVASIQGNELQYGTWKTKLEMETLKEHLTEHMKMYFDELFASDIKYVEILSKIGFKKGNTLFLDAVFPGED